MRVFLVAILSKRGKGWQGRGGMGAYDCYEGVAVVVVYFGGIVQGDVSCTAVDDETGLKGWG